MIHMMYNVEFNEVYMQIHMYHLLLPYCLRAAGVVCVIDWCVEETSNGRQRRCGALNHQAPKHLLLYVYEVALPSN